MNVVVVESPAKAKTINKYLGADFTVLASFGHVRDLPAKDGSVRPDEDFAMDWEVDPKSQTRIKAIADALKDADTLILATDPDREGEAISWHLLEALTKRRALKDKRIQRVAFNAITKKAVSEALERPRDVDMELVEAYLARRALDYLVGFTLSPVLWRKLPGSRSAGRVQSVALRLITEREGEIESFKAQEYWSVEADLAAQGAQGVFRARLSRFENEKITRLTIGEETRARAAEAAIRSASLSIASVEAKPAKRNPPPPFTTSTLQQEAARKLGFDAQRTMRAAQRLYEGVEIGGETVGLITYMRTDGVSMDSGAVAEARAVIQNEHGPDFVPEKPRFYTSKARNAQEAHEAIRPTSFSRSPDSLRLEADQARLYALIWKRAVASQMESARLERTTIDIENADGSLALRATGSVVVFPGFFALYQEGRDDEEDEGEMRLPAVRQGAGAKAEQTFAEQHFTQPPPRYSEASLVKKMEELGIGRPSTYASILTVLRDRDYVRMEDNRFVPEDKGRVVIAFLENFFKRYVEYDFTAGLEDQLDKVSAGELDWKELLRAFWRDFSASVEGIADLRVGNVIDAMNVALEPLIYPPREDGSDPRICPSCNVGTLSLRLGKHGAFVGCSNYPDCRYTRPLGTSEAPASANGDGALGEHPETGATIYLKDGRFGPYLEMQVQGEDKPRRGSLPKGWSPADLTFEQAVKLIDLPRLVGLHPEDGEPIEAGIGRYGPFVRHGSTYANLPNAEEVFEVGVNRAVDLIAQKKAGRGQRGGAGAAPLKELGEHPSEGGPVQVMSGRYGPYVKHGKINATLPRGADPQAITMDEAVILIAEKAAKGGKKAPARKAAKKPAAKKPAAKKAPAKKSGAKKAPAKKTAKKDAS
ncbi:type I DNA topoisomerase [Alkalicaulis satelles]|uniref:DNA topoisomerase 1 n=1 Tax=Alkalicaulis satelles TaxID=2609175 RepID=A0A5M6ZHJ8_9PROT|nr:type I DNA topoisomerase [Alkalicaulis satelles]KAA5801701.1 type I DNA topoisomerase [Alkalicaulis satelles]